MKEPMDSCPFCGSEEGYYTKDYFHGSTRTYVKFDGSEVDNGDMYENLSHKQGRNAYCIDCKRVLFKLSEISGAEASAAPVLLHRRSWRTRKEGQCLYMNVILAEKSLMGRDILLH